MSTYHHGHLREALVAAAVDAASERGPDGLALRDLARRVGVSHNAAYRHFADRDELVAAVAEQGMAQLVNAMQEKLAAVDSSSAGVDEVLRARRRLAALGRGYVEFALRQPGLFRVAFGSYPDQPDGEPDDEGAPTAAQPDPYSLLNEVLDDLVNVGFLDPAVRLGADTMCWSTVHGFAVLHLDGPLANSSDAEREEALDLVLVSIDRAFGSPDAPPLTPSRVDGAVNDR